MTETATIDDLADLLAQHDAVEAEIAAGAVERDKLHAEWRQERSRRHVVLARQAGEAPDPAAAEHEAADAAWQSRIDDQLRAITDAARRRQELARRIGSARRSKRQAQRRSTFQDGAGDVDALAADLAGARATHSKLATELETLNARHRVAIDEGDAAVLLEVTPRRREAAIESAAAQTALLRAEAAHARALVAHYAAESAEAEIAVEAAEEALRRAGDERDAAVSRARVASASGQTWQAKVRRADIALERHLAVQQDSAA